MDPASAVAAALAAGAVAGLKDTTSAMVKDAYASLRTLVVNKYKHVDIKALEQKPESVARRDSLAEDLREEGVDQDNQILDAAKVLAHILEQHAPDSAARAGVILRDVQAANVTILRVAGNVEVDRMSASGDVNIADVGVNPEATSPKG